MNIIFHQNTSILLFSYICISVRTESTSIRYIYCLEWPLTRLTILVLLPSAHSRTHVWGKSRAATRTLAPPPHLSLRLRYKKVCTKDIQYGHWYSPSSSSNPLSFFVLFNPSIPQHSLILWLQKRFYFNTHREVYKFRQGVNQNRKSIVLMYSRVMGDWLCLVRPRHQCVWFILMQLMYINI